MHVGGSGEGGGGNGDDGGDADHGVADMKAFGQDTLACTSSSQVVTDGDSGPNASHSGMITSNRLRIFRASNPKQNCKHIRPT